MESVVQSARPMFRGVVGRARVFAVLFACLVPLLAPSVPTEMQSISVAGAFATAIPEAIGDGGVKQRVRDVARAEVVLGIEASPIDRAEPSPSPTPESTVERAPAPTAAPAIATLPSLPQPPTGGLVIASWYGPGFYGNRTACGQIYTPEIIGVAHRTLRCGTMVVLEYRGRTMTVPVIDRGPYIAGRALDLSNATRLAMGCPDLCTLSMRIAQ